uniref:Uncharacterized protein n=1 Tax=Pristionchus pacificus TaxID=54126 RepID=A0A2A6CYW2_PRIPA|eukprot:PDM83359.1 hypothetical protein PRIPAC_34991 [Pristionchus pacificus]
MFSHGYLIWFAVVDVQQQVAFDRQKIEELLYRLLQYTFQQDARATVIINDIVGYRVSVKIQFTMLDI